MNKTEFIDIIMGLTNINNELDAERIANAVLHVLRSQLSSVEHIDIYDSLPKDIEAIWEGGWLQRLTSRIQGIRIMDKDDFIEQVRETADVSTTAEAEEIVKAVFIALKSALPYEEIDHINEDLPDEVSELWRAA